MSRLRILCLVLLAALPLAAADPPPAPQEVRFIFLFSGNKAGEAVSRVEANGERVYTFEFNDRGRGPKTTTRMRLDAQGLPVFEETTGHDYWKSPVDER